MTRRCLSALLTMVTVTVAASTAAPAPSRVAETSIRQFLARGDTQPSYRAIRRLEAESGDRKGWLEAVTEYTPGSGFHYTVTAEGGSESIRSKVLRAVLEGEREVIARGEAARSSLVPANYTFEPGGVDEQGLVNVRLSPRRAERALVAGRMLLQPADARLVRLEGRLAKSPSFWVKNVDIVRSYDRIQGVVLPVTLQSYADVRFLGGATFRMTYRYSHVNGRPVAKK